MSPQLAVVLTYGIALLGALVGLALDAADRRRAALAAVAGTLVLGGVVGAWASIGVKGAEVWGVVRVGGPFSAVPGAILLLAAVAVYGGWEESAERAGGGSSAALVALGAVASGLAASSFDLVMLLVAIETAALAGYALVAEARTSRAAEAAMKYFVQGAVATGLFVFGLAVVVGALSEGTGYAAINAALSDPFSAKAAAAATLLLLSALAFKASIAPFHSWAPDAYESARPEVSAFLSAGPKLGALVALTLVLLVTTTGQLQDRVLVPIAALSILSVVVGSFGALRQRSYTRMLAYAGIAQAGYALVGAVALNPTAVAFFATTYAIGATGTFLAAAHYRRVDPAWDGSIAGLAGKGRTSPGVSVGLAVLLVSLAGIPPLLGFWGKLQVFGSAIVAAQGLLYQGSQPLLGWTLAVAAGVAIVGSVVSLGYYGAVMRSLFFDETARMRADEAAGTLSAEDAERSAREGTTSRAGIAVIVLAVLVIAAGLAPLVWGSAAVLAPFIVR